MSTTSLILLLQNQGITSGLSIQQVGLSSSLSESQAEKGQGQSRNEEQLKIKFKVVLYSPEKR